MPLITKALNTSQDKKKGGGGGVLFCYKKSVPVIFMFVVIEAVFPMTPVF